MRNINIRNIVYRCHSIGKLDRLFLNNLPRVLFYHGVDTLIFDSTIETESIHARDFERQLQYISTHFKPVSVGEFYNRFINRTWQGKEILLTFDDGYRNMLTTGLPLLQKYNIPFAVFITVDNITNNHLFPTTINRLVNLAERHNPLETNRISTLLKTEPLDIVEKLCYQLRNTLPKGRLDELRTKYTSVNPMTWDEVRLIDTSPLCTIGSHCMSHICCHSRQEKSEISRQLSTSKATIERELGHTCDFLAWPNGNYTSESENLAAEAGYKMAFSTRYATVYASSIMSVGRIYVPYEYNRFKYAISHFGR